MKINTKRICSLAAVLLAAASVGGVMTACGGTADQPAPGTAAVVNDQQTEAVTQDELPGAPAKDFGGVTFIFLDSGPNDDNGSDWETYDIFQPEETGDVVIDAVYQRNLWLEERYHIRIAEKKSTGYTLDEVITSVAAGDKYYDAVMSGFQPSAVMASNGYLLDLNEVPVIDLNQSWWDQAFRRDMTIGGKNYFMTGDITIVDNNATWVLMFSKELAKQYDYNFYDQVRAGTWTIDAFYAAIKSAALDLNGDGKMKPMDDQWGFATPINSVNAMLFGGEARFSMKDKEDYPVLISDLSHFTDVALKVGEVVSDKSVTCNRTLASISFGDLAEIFTSGRSLFYGNVLQSAISMRTSETDFGVLPWPKYDEAQKGYHTFVHNSAGKAVSITILQDNLELAGTVLEAMAAKSVSTVTEAYYDKAMTYKYMRDEDSIEMLKIIFADRIFDLEQIYEWGDLAYSMMEQVNAGKTDLLSKWEKYLSKAEAEMAETVAAFKAVN